MLIMFAVAGAFLSLLSLSAFGLFFVAVADNSRLRAENEALRARLHLDELWTENDARLGGVVEML